MRHILGRILCDVGDLQLTAIKALQLALHAVPCLTKMLKKASRSLHHSICQRELVNPLGNPLPDFDPGHVAFQRQITDALRDMHRCMIAILFDDEQRAGP